MCHNRKSTGVTDSIINNYIPFSVISRSQLCLLTHLNGLLVHVTNYSCAFPAMTSGNLCHESGLCCNVIEGSYHTAQTQSIKHVKCCSITSYISLIFLNCEFCLTCKCRIPSWNIGRGGQAAFKALEADWSSYESNHPCFVTVYVMVVLSIIFFKVE